MTNTTSGTSTNALGTWTSVPYGPAPREPRPCGELAAALAAVQAELPKVVKAKSARVQSRTGASYGYDYADLADVNAVLPILAKNGLSFLCKPTLLDGKFVLAYSLLHASGQREDGVYPLPAGDTPQAIGSAITYARRYCLTAVTGIAPEGDDDDGQNAQEAAARKAPARNETQPAAGPGRAQRPPAERRNPKSEPDAAVAGDLARLAAKITEEHGTDDSLRDMVYKPAERHQVLAVKVENPWEGGRDVVPLSWVITEARKRIARHQG